jgi:hypothetical protein
VLKNWVSGEFPVCLRQHSGRWQPALPRPILIVFLRPRVNQQPGESKIAPMDTNSIVRILPLVSILLAVVCVLVQALMPVSRTKGTTHLAGSTLLGGGLCAQSLIQMASQHGFWAKVILLPMGGVLIWLGVRKHSRDPEGRTPPQPSFD